MNPDRILVVAAHPDDEALGCGATLAKHVRDGAEVAVLFLTNGTGARGPDAEAARHRREAMEEANSILGVQGTRCLDFPDNALDTVGLLGIAQAIEEFCRDSGFPRVVYTHHRGDLNVDHQLVHRAVLTCFRPQPGRQVEELLTFEVPSSTGWYGTGAPPFAPNHFEDVTATLDLKIRALEAYAAEMRPWPHARSLQAVDHLARYRGSQVGVEAAEAFLCELRLKW